MCAIYCHWINLYLVSYLTGSSVFVSWLHPRKQKYVKGAVHGTCQNRVSWALQLLRGVHAFSPSPRFISTFEICGAFNCIWGLWQELMPDVKLISIGSKFLVRPIGLYETTCPLLQKVRSIKLFQACKCLTISIKKQTELWSIYNIATQFSRSNFRAFKMRWVH